jgi:hypothetical protein
MLILFLIEAGLLIVLMQGLTDAEIDLITGVVIALVTSTVTGLIAFGLVSLIGPAGSILAAVIGAAGLGVAISAFFGAEIKRSFLIGGIYVVVHILLRLGMSLLTG